MSSNTRRGSNPLGATNIKEEYYDNKKRTAMASRK